VCHGFGQAKFTYGGSILSSSQFTLLPPLLIKMVLGLKEVKIESKKATCFDNLKSVTRSVVIFKF